jgi:hypothetical protein
VTTPGIGLLSEAFPQCGGGIIGGPVSVDAVDRGWTVVTLGTESRVNSLHRVGCCAPACGCIRSRAGALKYVRHKLGPLGCAVGWGTGWAAPIDPRDRPPLLASHEDDDRPRITLLALAPTTTASLGC